MKNKLSISILFLFLYYKILHKLAVELLVIEIAYMLDESINFLRYLP
jgi:hypothetical protein